MPDEQLGSAVLVLSTKAAELIAGIDKGKVAADGLVDHFKSVSSQINQALAFIGVGFSLSSVIRATAEAEDASSNLASAVRSSGMAAGFTAEQLQLQAAALQSSTRFGDEAIMGMQATLMTFRNITGSVFLDTEKAVLDFAQATGRDAAEAARTLGMALNDPVNGMQMLRRAGVSLSDAMKDQIQTLAEHGDLIGAQTLLIGEFAKAYGGRATDSVNTLGGALDQLKNKFEDFFLEIKGPVRDTFVEFTRWLTSILGNIAAFVNGMFAVIKSVVEDVVTVLYKLGEGVVLLFERKFKAAIGAFDEALTTTALSIPAMMVRSSEAFDATTASISAMEKQMNSAAATTATLGPAMGAVGVVPGGDLLSPISASMAFPQMQMEADAYARMQAEKLMAVQRFFGAESSQRDLWLNAAGRTFQSMSSKWGSNISAMIVDGEVWRQNFGDILKDILRMFIQVVTEMMIRWIAMKAVMGILSMGASAAASPAISNSSLAGGATMGGGDFAVTPIGGWPGMAEGGAVTKGATYWVGEKGPEIFTAPADGTITPSGQASGGQTVSISMVNHIYEANDPDAVGEAIVRKIRGAGQINFQRTP